MSGRVEETFTYDYLFFITQLLSLNSIMYYVLMKMIHDK
jgi:hypothetical protein